MTPFRQISRSPEFWLFVFASIVTLVILRSATPFSVRLGLQAMAAGLLITVPLGALIVNRVLLAGSLTLKLALVAPAGYAASIFVGFALGYLGLLSWYGVFHLAALGLLLWTQRGLATRLMPGSALTLRKGLSRVGPGALTLLGRVSPAAWIAGAVTLLGVLAATPLMAPLRAVTPTQYIDYVLVDPYYYMIRAKFLADTVPAAVWPDLAGVAPLVLPDFHLFWLGQIHRLSEVGIRDIYFIYGPILLIVSNSLLLYGFGKETTGSPWGGALAAGLANIVLIANPYDVNAGLRLVEDGTFFAAYKTRFWDMLYNQSIGVGWQLVTVAVLAAVVIQRQKDRRLHLGVLVVAGLALAVLLRIRPHYFVVAAPPFAIGLLALCVTRRSWHYWLPLGVFALCVAGVFVESTYGPYAHGTAQLALVYGPYGERAAILNPEPLSRLLAGMWGWLRPFAGVVLLTFTALIGFAFSLVLATAAIVAVARRRRPSLAQAYLACMLLGAILAASVVIVEAWIDSHGDWGGQMLRLTTRLALLMVIPPIFAALHALVLRRAHLNPDYRPLIIGVIALFAVITWRGAEAALYAQSARAYSLSSRELNAYAWIRHNTPPQAVIAAHPDHQVNQRGETVTTTNFISGMTERAAYSQRHLRWYDDVVHERRQLLVRLFETSDVDEAQTLLNQATFDYLLVYPEQPPAVDLSCCLELVRDGLPQVYQRVPDSMVVTSP